jgi:hypothetical protein
MPQFSRMMRDAISNVLETMFFLVPAFEEGEKLQGFSQGPFLLESSITITGEEGRLRLHFRATRAFASIITANFLGVGPEEVSPEEMEDTLKELANMVGGDCLSRLPADNWALGIPKLEPARTSTDDYSTPQMYSLLLSLDEELMALIHLYVEP